MFSCFLGNLQFLFCRRALMTFSILVSRHRSNFSLRDICSPRTSRPAVGTALSVLFDSHLLLSMLFSPAVGCALLACWWLCSSRLLVAVLFCLFTPLIEILVDLLLFVVQVLRLCPPFRQSGFASFVDFFSPLALLAVVLFLFSVFWRRLLQHYAVVSLLLRGSPQAPPTPLLGLRHFVIIGSRLVLAPSQHRCFATTWSAVCEVWLHSVWSGRFVAPAVRRWSPTPLCDTLPRRDPLVRPTPLCGHRSSCLSLSSDFSA